MAGASNDDGRRRGTRLHRSVMQALISDIVEGRLAEGKALPTEQEFATSFAVSRGVAREAMRGLEERGLVSVRHGSGTYVTPALAWDLFDEEVLQALLHSPRNWSVLRDYLECRRILEIEAAGLAAERASSEDLTCLSQALSRMESSVQPGPEDAEREALFHQADVDFHKALIAATGNHALASLAGRIHSSLLAARYPLARPKYRLERALPEHRRILAGVAANDAEAARSAMRDHLATVEGYLREESQVVPD